MKVSIVTPTYFRYTELTEFFVSIFNQKYKPHEIVIVDGAPLDEVRSEVLIKELQKNHKEIKYYRFRAGQRFRETLEWQKAEGDIILFIDDDVRIGVNFISELVQIFTNDVKNEIGGITGYRENCYFNMLKTTRWIWYRRLNLLKEFTPGKYDYQTGYPINNNGMFPFSGVREVDFMTTACTAYRSRILKNEVKFDSFFVGYGILEDAHLSLKIKSKGYILLQSGDAKCIELASKNGRTNRKIIGERTVVNYYYVFDSVAGPLNLAQKIRFFKFQIFELFRAFIDIIRFRNYASVHYFQGKIIGNVKILFFRLK